MTALVDRHREVFMKRLLFLLALSMAVLVIAPAGALAQELDSKWLLGKWWGGNPNSKIEVEFKGDGTFTGGSSSANGLFSYRSGSWKVVGNELTADFTLESPRPDSGPKVTWTLKLQDKDLVGEGFRHFDNRQYNLQLKKAN
jgi:uncharacterized protein (TIGR03066 family)